MGARVVAAVTLLVGATVAAAEVTRATPGGLGVELAAESSAAPGQLWTALTEVGRWWSPDHTYSGDAANLSLDARAGGCFCEALADGGSVRHLAVVYVQPGRVLRLEGPLGPLQSGAVTGMMTFTLEAVPAGTRVTLTYVAAGFHPSGDLATWAPLVEAVLRQQLERLVRLAATGSPTPPEPPSPS